MKKNVLQYPIGIALAIVIGYLDTHMAGDDNFGSVAVLLIAAFLMSVAFPRNAWLWALLFGLAIPAAHLICAWAGIPVAYVVKPNMAATLLALIPSSLGALFGYGARSFTTAIKA